MWPKSWGNGDGARVEESYTTVPYHYCYYIVMMKTEVNLVSQVRSE